MGYGDDIQAILDDLLSKIEALGEFNYTGIGYTAAIGEHQNIPSCFVLMASEPLRESSGAHAEARDLTIEFWTLNRESHSEAIRLAGLIVDTIDADKTLSGKVLWSRCTNAECFIKPEIGYSLNWSKVTYEFERRRSR